MVIAQNVKNLTPECTLSLAWISLSFLRANTWICDETCFRVLVLPVRNLIYLAISSFLPGKNKQRKILEIFLKKMARKKSMRICTHMRWSHSCVREYHFQDFNATQCHRFMIHNRLENAIFVQKLLTTSYF